MCCRRNAIYTTRCKRQRSRLLCVVFTRPRRSHLSACIYIYVHIQTANMRKAALFKHDLPGQRLIMRSWFTLVPGAHQYLFCSPRYSHYRAQQQPIKRFINLRKVSRTGRRREHSPGGRRKPPHTVYTDETVGFAKPQSWLWLISIWKSAFFLSCDLKTLLNQ